MLLYLWHQCSTPPCDFLITKQRKHLLPSPASVSPSLIPFHWIWLSHKLAVQRRRCERSWMQVSWRFRRLVGIVFIPSSVRSFMFSWPQLRLAKHHSGRREHDGCPRFRLTLSWEEHRDCASQRRLARGSSHRSGCRFWGDFLYGLFHDQAAAGDAGSV